MGVYAILADALCYPRPGRLIHLDQLTAKLLPGPIKTAYERFLNGIRPLTLGEWEELYTRTFDLNPPAAPYIGYQNWGDSYQRGSFLSMLNRAIETHRIDTEGELPDHLIPVLRLLDCLPEPFPEVQEIMEKSTLRIRDGLVKADPHNPYGELLEAIYLACKEGNASLAQTTEIGKESHMNKEENPR